MRMIWVLVAVIFAPSAPVLAQPVPVSSDPRASYTALEITPQPRGLVEILTRREGPSGVTFALREIDCARGRFRYLGEGDTAEAAKQRRSARTNQMGPLSEGSISAQVAQHACAGRRSGGAAAPPPPPPSREDIALARSRDLTAHVMAVEKLKESLRDPGSLQTESVNVFRYGAITERAVCGVYNARNAMGGYAGRQPFISRVTFAPGLDDRLRVDPVPVTQAAIARYCVGRAP